MDACLGTRRFVPLNAPDQQTIARKRRRLVVPIAGGQAASKVPPAMVAAWADGHLQTSWEPEKESIQASQTPDSYLICFLHNCSSHGRSIV